MTGSQPHGQTATRMTLRRGEPSGFASLGASGLGVWRVTLGAGKNGAHTLVSQKPVGLQVMGYGSYTSYQYPGGLNLKLIAPPPPPPR